MSVPADCLTRRELQALISRVSGLAERTTGELALLLDRLARAAAAVEGFMDELPEEAAREPTRRGQARERDLARLLANPHCWSSRWAEQSLSAPTPAGDLRVALSQQLLFSPNRPRSLIGTGRYRLSLGGRAVELSPDRRRTRELVGDYLSEFGDVPPPVAEFVGDLLDSY